jgi:methylated-DNA-protein-cysteine methyltransferase-like protein
MSSNTFRQIYDIVAQIPHGKVTTYGTVARLAGNPRLSRVVGWALHSNPDPGDGEEETIPCHRVLNREGRCCEGFAFGGKAVQIALLRGEGIEVSDEGVVDLAVFGW